jgi:PAS domain S-box-containing protein
MMDRSILPDNELNSHASPSAVWRAGSFVVGGVAAILAVATLIFRPADHGQELLTFAIAVFCLIATVHARFLYLARKQFRITNGALETRELEFQSIFENALDSILILDGHGTCRDANPSALQLLGVPSEQLLGQSIAMFYSDRRTFDSFWELLLTQDQDRGQSEMVRANGTHIFVEFTAKTNFLPDRHMMVMRDISLRRKAEEAKTESLALAKSAWQEADALRKATLALTQDLRMNSVLDTLLQTISLLVPYETAQVLLLETDSKLFLAREAFSVAQTKPLNECPKTLNASDHPILHRVLGSQDGAFISDTLRDGDWRAISEGVAVRSWLGVPLRSANQVVGLLSVAHSAPGRFTAEHLRITGSLAIPAAVAIQNARLYERAEIYGEELERRLSDLHQVEQALGRSEEGRKASEERFRKVFRATPIAFSVTSLADGTFIDVNETFERRYGYTRNELIGRTPTELGFWEDPRERGVLIDRLRGGARIRGAVARLVTKSGEVKTSLYSAETIQLDNQPCLLLVSDDFPCADPQYLN